MIIDGPWDSATFTKAMGNNVGVFRPPFSTKPMNGLIQFPGDGFGITSYSQHKTEAAGFLNFLTTNQAATILNKAGDIPSVSGAPVSNPLNKAMLKLGAEPGATIYPMIDNVVQGDVVDAGSKILPSVLAGRTGAASALEQLEQAWTQLPPDQRSSTFK
jgi:raffinose/stachyose/melibiose transport system substrate-binding protein